MAAVMGQHWPATGLVHLVVSIAFASVGALCDFIAVPVFDVVLGRDLSAADHVRLNLPHAVAPVKHVWALPSSQQAWCLCVLAMTAPHLWLQEHAKAVETDPAYRSVLHSFAAVHLASLVSSCYVAGTFDLHPLALTGE